VSESAAVQADTITIGDFAKVMLRTAVVLEAERVPKSEKLLKLQVDIGTERRQILAGIAKHYAPEDLVGMTIVVVANLAPAKLMGHVSQGMVLAASTADGRLALVTPAAAGLGAGAEVR
jgi:methionyl-tRNA synthetase